MKILKIAVLVSGNGSNLQALINQIQNNQLPIHIVAVISNKANAYALTRAKNANIPTFIIDKNKHNETYKRTEFERLTLDILKQFTVDLVVLAGFMKILTPLFVNGVADELHCPIINLHPSLLPQYKGLDTHKRTLKSGDRLHGCTVHLVTDELDSGQIISQMVTFVHPNDTPITLQNKIHALEHQLLPRTLTLIAKGVIDLNHVGEPYLFANLHET